MDTNYNSRFKLHLTGIDNPIITFGLDGETFTRTLDGSVEITYDLDLDVGPHRFVLNFNNKTNETPNRAVIIEAVEIESLRLDRFKWAGVYTPQYPEPWASEQIALADTLPGATFLGWNGTWMLDLTVPLFTWIHKTENLGWIYD